MRICEIFTNYRHFTAEDAKQNLPVFMILMLYVNNDEEKWRDKKRTHAHTQKKSCLKNFP